MPSSAPSQTSSEPSSDASQVQVEANDGNGIKSQVMETQFEQKERVNVLGKTSFVLDPTHIQNNLVSEQNADLEFQKELANQLAALLLQYRAWSSAHPEAERQNKMDKLNENYSEIAHREQQQDNTRAHYADLLVKVRLLIAMFP